MSILQAIRRNHAIEHATVAVLMRKLKPGTRLVGMAGTDGFYVYGQADPETISEAASEALARLKSGEHELAVSPMCGTNLVTTALLAGLGAVMAIKGKNRAHRLPNVFMATLAGVLVAQPLGRILQKYLTTSPDVSGFQIAGVSSRGTRHKIKTLRS
ncbi:MAG: hypothetical protein IBX68_00305 [Dehalococcoidia bacterium]|nr:hypothetical protein [Dehalococcoidia bacterium]